MTTLVGCTADSHEDKPISFTSDDLLNSLEILAHDSLEGRGFATAGNRKAQQFINDQFAQLRLEPAIGDSYLQPFNHTIS